MTKLIKSFGLDGNPEFMIQVIDNNGQLWVRLSEEEDVTNFFGFWSEKEGVEGKDSVDDVIKELSVRLEGQKKEDLVSLQQALEFWPEGWEHWSNWMPKPISDYLRYELEDEIKSFTQA